MGGAITKTAGNIIKERASTRFVHVMLQWYQYGLNDKRNKRNDIQIIQKLLFPGTVYFFKQREKEDEEYKMLISVPDTQQANEM